MSTPANQTMDASHPSICIPRTFANIRWMQVKAVFEQLFGDGAIERVDVVRKTAKDGTSFNCMFVHFNAWPTDEHSQNVRQNIIDGKSIKIVYDDPWYWKCTKSRLSRPEKRYSTTRPYIVDEAAVTILSDAGGTADASATDASATDASATDASATDASSTDASTVTFSRPLLHRGLQYVGDIH
jgi:hypothetical protein